MKQILIKIFKLFLVLTAIALGILLVFGISLTLGWPWWVGLFILVGILGLWMGVIFFKKLWLRRREQQFVNQVIEQDDRYLKQMSGKDKEHHQELQHRWKEAMVALKQSQLKKFGNPLYVLPWYMLIGESGSGKTTAIESARLSSPFAEVSRTSGISGTRNCDWWFFEQAVLIDTAGRYAIPVDEGRDKEEWQSFLSLLAKFRKREPLNGLVVTVSADKLLESGSEALEADGKSIRQRVDELMRVLGAKFPIYVLVTKCDLVQGMNLFCGQLTDEALEQPMGLIRQELSGDIAGFLDRAIEYIGERMRDLRLLIFHKTDVGTDPALLLFPEEFERLKPGLTAFFRGAFHENPYQESPILRGLYFSSGRQEGSPYSHFLKELHSTGFRMEPVHPEYRPNGLAGLRNCPVRIVELFICQKPLDLAGRFLGIQKTPYFCGRNCHRRIDNGPLSHSNLKDQPEKSQLVVSPIRPQRKSPCGATAQSWILQTFRRCISIEL